jgi:hypothetical protein
VDKSNREIVASNLLKFEAVTRAHNLSKFLAIRVAVYSADWQIKSSLYETTHVRALTPSSCNIVYTVKIFRVSAPCTLVGRIQRFGSAYFLLRQCWRYRRYVSSKRRRLPTSLRATKPRRPSSFSPLWKPQISQLFVKVWMWNIAKWWRFPHFKRKWNWVEKTGVIILKFKRRKWHIQEVLKRYATLDKMKPRYMERGKYLNN